MIYTSNSSDTYFETSKFIPHTLVKAHYPNGRVPLRSLLPGDEAGKISM